MDLKVNRQAEMATVTVTLSKRDLDTLLRVLSVVEGMMNAVEAELPEAQPRSKRSKQRSDGYRVVQ